MFTGWSLARLALYAVFLIASALSLLNLADFDAATGAFDLRPFNIYSLVGATSGIGASGLAILAIVKGWVSRK